MNGGGGEQHFGCPRNTRNMSLNFMHSPDDTLELIIPTGDITTTINRSELLPFIPLAIET